MFEILLYYICFFFFFSNVIGCSLVEKGCALVTKETGDILPEYIAKGEAYLKGAARQGEGELFGKDEGERCLATKSEIIEKFKTLMKSEVGSAATKLKWDNIKANPIILEDAKKDDTVATQNTIGWTCNYLEKIEIFDGLEVPVIGFGNNKYLGVYMGADSDLTVSTGGSVYEYEPVSKPCSSFPELGHYDEKIREYNPSLKNKADLILNKKLCYLKSRGDGKKIIPVLKVSGDFSTAATEGTTDDNINEDDKKIKILEFFHPLKSSYIPTFTVKKQDYNKEPTLREKNRGSFPDVDPENSRGTTGETTGSKKEGYLEFSVDLDVENFDSVNNDLQISNFSSQTIFNACARSLCKYTSTFKIDKRYWDRNKDNIAKGGLQLQITGINKEFGFTFSKVLILNLTTEFIALISRKMEDITENNNGDPYHNYGLSWGEKDLGPTIVSRYLNEMDNHNGGIGHAFREYYWNGFNSWERDYLDKNQGGLNGLDHENTDNVDMAAYVGHGNGNGITFETNQNDTLVRFSDVVDSWGNLDCEYHAWQSCQVLEDTWGGLQWWERWGPVFNGLHLIHGFITNAGVDGHNLLKFFAQNQYDNNRTMKRAWFDAVIDDQNSGRTAAVMGVMISESKDPNGTVHNSIPATTSGYRRAHWKDKINARGTDVPKADIKGWWRVSMTV
jgi:hypothetical protein